MEASVSIRVSKAGSKISKTRAEVIAVLKVSNVVWVDVDQWKLSFLVSSVRGWAMWEKW